MTEPGGAPAEPAPDAAETPHPEPPPEEAAGLPPRGFWPSVRAFFDDYFLGERPTFATALVPLCFLSMALFTRHPLRTNFIFDEQEALLANPYVRAAGDPASTIGWLSAFTRDFWGLTPERSIGSYRPLPNLVWRALWKLGAREQSPFLHHWVNVLLHGTNGALLVVLVVRLGGSRRLAWTTGALFVATAVLTEAVTGVVGLSDVLGGMGVILALLATTLRSVPLATAGAAGGVLFGLLAKESAMAAVPAVAFAAYAWAHLVAPARPRRLLRGLVTLAAAALVFVAYVEGRRRLFPTTPPAELAADAVASRPALGRAFAAVLRWFAQPGLPRDAINNPLVLADTPHRVAGALRVYARGLGQVLAPITLSGDYSFPQEPIPPRLVDPTIALGGLAMVLPLPVAAWLAERSARRARAHPGRVDPAVDARPLVAVGLAIVVLFYFPVSNVPVLLPTVRAERFWYFPAIGTALVLAVAFARLGRALAARGRGAVAAALLGVFLVGQGLAARRHANDYKDDLTFWQATVAAVPRSAKAHLNYSVMKGARHDLETRLASNARALELAPEWPMASVYYADTLCRLHRAAEAWPYYEKGFRLAPNDTNLLGLGLQCLWDEKRLDPNEPDNVRDRLETLAVELPGTWVEVMGNDLLVNGDKHGGVDPKHRPRSYNEGPKD